MHVVLVGPDRELGTALAAAGADVARVTAPATAAALADAGIDDAALLVLTDVAEATAVPIAREANPAVRVVAYSPDALPEFVRAQVDLAVSPDVLAAAVVAEELVGAA
jgi:Trk K+ transport system NAD-binding subunit